MPNRVLSPGERLSASVQDEFELLEHELVILEEAARTLDLCASLQEVVDGDGPLMPTRSGVRAHPAAVELRQQRITLARLLAALRIPWGEDGAAARVQRRAVRGVYGVGAA